MCKTQLQCNKSDEMQRNEKKRIIPRIDPNLFIKLFVQIRKYTMYLTKKFKCNTFDNINQHPKKYIYY